MAERMQEIFDETTDCVIKLMKDVHETFRVRKQEAAEDDADTVTIAKEDYETMIDDLLTMSEIIQCVADMRTQAPSRAAPRTATLHACVKLRPKRLFLLYRARRVLFLALTKREWGRICTAVSMADIPRRNRSLPF